jgi:hypothetical protein
MNLVVRFFCPDCKAECRGVTWGITYGGLPGSVFVGRFPHKKDCQGAGDVFVEVFEGEYEDAPPPVDGPVDTRHETAQRQGSILDAGTRPRGEKLTPTTPNLDRGYASVRADEVEKHVEIQLVDDDRAIGVVFRQSEVGECVRGEWCDAPGKITLTMSPALAHALLKKLLVVDANNYS